MIKLKINNFAFWAVIAISPLIVSCTMQDGFRTTDPKQQTLQAGENFLNTGRWRPLPTTQRTRTLSYIATEGFQIPSGFVETTVLENELRDFVITYKITQDDTILLDGLRDGSGMPTRTSENAINRIKFALREIGFNSKKTDKPIAILDPSRHNAAIMVHRKIIIAPECEIKPHPNGTRPIRRTFGCVQEVNLANMVVSPEALDGSLPLSPGDSTAAALGVDRYRKGAVTPLTTDLSTNSGS